MSDKQSLFYVVKWLPLLALLAATNVAYAAVTADAGGPYEAKENVFITFDASGSDCTSPCDPDPASFHLEYEWDFGDGNQQAPNASPTTVHDYDTAQSYEVTVRVRNTLDDTFDDDTAEVIILKGSQKPEADAGGPYSGIQNEEITFDGTSSSDPNGDIETYEWRWGDGTPNDTGAIATHAFAGEDTYSVTLTVTDSEELSDTDTEQVVIGTDNLPPTAYASPGPPYFGSIGLAVQFDGSASNDNDGTIDQYDWDYGDGTVDLDAGPFPSHIYAGAATGSQEYPVTLTVTDNRGALGVDETTAIITQKSNNAPIARGIPEDVEPPVYRGAVGEAIQLDGSDSIPADQGGSIDRWDWNFGDGSTPAIGVGPMPNANYQAAGVYELILTVWDPLNPAPAVGSSDTVLVAVKADGENRPPVADAGGPYEADVNEDIDFDGTRSSDLDQGDVIEYVWDFGDGSPEAFGPTPNYSYDAPDVYTVTLTVNDGEDFDETTTTASIGQVTPAPVADAGPAATGTVNNLVFFDGSGSSCADNCVLEYDWEFGDGVVGNNGPAKAQHLYTTPGDYTVTLTVRRQGTDQQDTDTTSAVISPGTTNEPPIADAGGPDGFYTGVAGMPVSFDGSQSSDDGTIVRYDWNFGDDIGEDLDAGPTTDYTYADMGQYTVRLTVTDDNDVPDSDDALVRIDLPNAAPTARPGGPYNVADGIAVEFDGTGSTDVDGEITLYEWDFEDDGIVDDSSGPEPVHTYPNTGSFTVSLKVTDNDGLADTQEGSVLISTGNQAPVADAGAAAYTGLIGAEVTFDGTGSSDPDGDALTYEWDFGDNSPRVNGVRPRHTYTTAGPFGVVLQVRDSEGLPAADDTIALIGSGTTPPVADAGGPYPGLVGTAIDFDGSASSDPDGGRLRYAWDFGDDSIPTSGSNPSHMYTTEGPFEVTMTVIDDTGRIAVDITQADVGSGNLPLTAIAASSLPSSRSVQVGNLASVFATIINGSATAAIDCSLAPQTDVAADFAYWTTDAANVPTGNPNTPASIPGNGSQNFIFGFAPREPISPTEVLMTYDCANTDPAPVTVGLNTLLLSAEVGAVPDIVALAATASGDGIVNLPGSNGSNAFSVSTVNVGSTATITAAPRPSVSLNLVMSICETNATTGVCLSGPGSSATSSVGAGATPTYSVFITATGDVPFDAANNRIIVEFKDGDGVVRGSTSVAVRTQ